MPGGTVALKANKAGIVQTACADNLDLSAANVLVLSSADQTVANYQMWRLAVVTLDALNTEAAALVPTPAAGAGGRSFSGVETAVSIPLPSSKQLKLFCNERVGYRHREHLGPSPC